MTVDAAIWRAIAARVGWTALQAGLGVLLPYLMDAPYWWALPIASVLSVLKNVAATKFGEPGTLVFSKTSVDQSIPTSVLIDDVDDSEVVTIDEFRRDQGVTD